MRNTAIPAARKPIPSSGRPCIARLLMTTPSSTAVEDRARELGQIEQADVHGAVAAGEQACGQGGGRHRGGGGEQSEHDAGDWDRARQHACGSSAAGCSERYWWTISTTISASPTASRPNVWNSRKRWVSSSEAPQKAATGPGGGEHNRSRGRAERSRLNGGVSSNVSSDRTNAAAEIAATTQNSGRHACALACRPPTAGRARRRRRCTCS